ncbi:MAG: glycosyltransferase [Bacillota bacterium]
MKVFIIGPDYINFLYSLERTISSLGCEVSSSSYRHPVKRNWLKRKLSNLGVGPSNIDYVNKYQCNYSDTTTEMVKTFAPDVLIILNGDFLHEHCLPELSKYSKRVVLYTLDAIYRFTGINKILSIANKVVCMDERDIAYLKQKYPLLDVSSCQFGYDPEMFYPDKSVVKDVDISFIGAPTNNRKKILTQVARFAHENKFNLAVYGTGYWDKRYWWKKRAFVKKYGYLFDYCSNNNVSAEQAAEIYRHSKICLNIHIEDHDIINNRCFEIPACGSLMFCDVQPHLRKYLRPGLDYIEYGGDEIESLLTEYLSNENKRDLILSSGCERINKHTVEKLARALLDI